MNIDPHLIRGLNYFKREARSATYTSVVPTDYEPIAGVPETTDTDFPVTALLQKHEQMTIGEVISSDDMLCIIYGKIIFVPKEDDKLLYEGDLYTILKVYRNISQQVIIANVRK